MIRLMPTLLFVSVAFLAHGQRSINPDIINSTGLIRNETGASMGSGFYVRTTNNTFLVTAKHVLFGTPTQSRPVATNITVLSYAGTNTDQSVVLAMNLYDLMANTNILIHAEHDVAVVRFSALEDKNPNKMFLFPSVELILDKSVGPVVTPIFQKDRIRLEREAYVGNDVFLFGFPLLGLDNQIDPNRPLLRKGILAGRNLAKRTLIIDAPAYYGNSGGPVLQYETVNFQNVWPLIGIVTQFVPYAERKTNSWQIIWNSGYAVIEPIDFALELMEKFPN